MIRWFAATKRFFAKPYRFGLVFASVLTVAFTLVLLDAFVFPRVYRNTDDSRPLPYGIALGDGDAPEAVISDTSYVDDNISIQIETIRVYGTTVHIADIKVNDVRYLKTALAYGQYGRNVNQTTSEMAGEHNAILAINGDYYGFRDEGYVLRNGTLYREGGNGDALALDSSGNLTCEAEDGMPADFVASAWQIWSFGPALVRDSIITVEPNSEISGRSANSNPRTAIGQVEPLHYVFIVSEGRTSSDEGLSLYQLAEVFIQRGCAIAYNLDGGGSSTMVFNGEVINSPTTNGRNIVERKVSDIVYVGYR
jgi:exopolysaccharide biosynthesis protein